LLLRSYGHQTPPPRRCCPLASRQFSLNPIIYARFNRDFRTPFKEILMGRCRGINDRLRSERYAEQFGDPAAGSCGTPRRQRHSVVTGDPAAGSRSHRPSVDTVVRYNCTQGYTYVRVGASATATARHQDTPGQSTRPAGNDTVPFSA